MKGGQPAPVTSGFPASCTVIMKGQNIHLIPIVRKKEADHHASLVRIITILLIFALLAFAGCSASSKDTSYPGEPDYGEDSGAPMETTTASMNSQSGAGDVDKLDANRKIIRNASLDMTVVDVTAVYESILAQAQSYGGYELSRQQSEQNDYIFISAAIRIPPENLDAFIEFIKQAGNVININISTDDITENYYDTEIRLENMEKNLDKYYEYLEESRNIEDTIMVQNQINSLTMEIESLKGKLKLWDSQLSESTVALNIRQENDPVQVRKEVNWNALSLDDMSYLMTSGLKSVVNFLTGAGQWLLIILVAAAPIWVPLLIIIILLVRRSRKRRKQRAIAMAAQQQQWQQYNGQQGQPFQPMQHSGQPDPQTQQQNLNQVEGTQSEGENKQRNT